MKIVLTGSSTGIGAALAARLVSRGHLVWGLARSPSPAASRSSRADVADWPSVAAAAESVKGEWGTIGALVSCAGIQGEIGRTISTDPARWAATVGVNLLGTYHAIRAFHSLLRPAAPARAKIVCFSGGGATKPRSHFSAYGAAKTAVVRLVETIAEEERQPVPESGPLDINAIAPGAINTRLTDEVIAQGPILAGRAEYEAALKQKQTGGASLDRALDLVEWLLSARSDGVTGKLISAPWDPWDKPEAGLRSRLTAANDDVYTLRRVTPPGTRGSSGS
ncbi:MAG TPA: SDR family oxidoreductase [Opitutaceae bacterium]|jgi:NAD(P)-dependent dehydrogenase (short-subunit alcohol dehydrogenase family)